MLTQLRTTWRSNGWVRFLIGLPLCLMLWNAPIPWIHRHDMAEATADADLAWHLHAFHHSRDASHDSETWHWHFACLWQIMDCDQTPGDEQDSHLGLMLGDSSPCLSAPAVTPRELLERDCFSREALAGSAGLLFCVQPPELHSHSPDDSRQFLSAAPLRDLLGVSRC